MREAWAILLDAYRDLNSRKVVTVVLVVSALLAAIFGVLGVTPVGFTILGFEIPSGFFNSKWMSPAVFYKTLFLAFGVEFWLQWPAAAMAPFSTAGMFPDLVTSGSIDLYLCRPISRPRLFLLKYLSGLIFVALQVTVWCLAAFLVIGLRGGDWEPGVFIAVPVMVLFYSYLHCMCVLVGVLTRSTITAIVVTLLFWIIVSFAHGGDILLMTIQNSQHRQATQLDQRIAAIQNQLDHVGASSTQSMAGATIQSAATAPTVISAANPIVPSAGPSGRSRDEQNGGWLSSLVRGFQSAATKSSYTRDQLEAMLSQAQEQRSQINTQVVDRLHKYLYGVMTCLPKTAETINLLERVVVARPGFQSAEQYNQMANSNDPRAQEFAQRRAENSANSAATQEELRARSVTWVVGTSLVFEAVILGLAGWVFCRRDY